MSILGCPQLRWGTLCLCCGPSGCAASTNYFANLHQNSVIEVACRLISCLEVGWSWKYLNKFEMSWPTHQWPSNNLSPPGARAASDHRKEQHYLNGSSNEYEEILSHRSKRKEIWLFMVFLDLLQIRFQQTPKAFEGLPRTSQAVRLGWLGHPSNSHCHPRPHRQTMKTSLWWGPVGFFLTSRLFFFCLARLHFSIKK